LFTIASLRLYARAMIVTALIAASLAQPAEVRPGPVLQATATVRIVSGKRLRLGRKAPEAELRNTRLRDSGGQVRPARLIGFH
jgi:hypothetical protein